MEKRVEKAIDIFLDAINNGHLAKGTCKACAVGNLVANGMGAKLWVESDGMFNCDKDNSSWFYENLRDFKSLREKSIINVEATDFSAVELHEIERVFEDNTRISFVYYHKSNKKEIRADQIKGLEAVVKVMLDFTNDESDVKEVFTKKAELIEL